MHGIRRPRRACRGSAKQMRCYRCEECYQGLQARRGGAARREFGRALSVKPPCKLRPNHPRRRQAASRRCPCVPVEPRLQARRAAAEARTIHHRVHSPPHRRATVPGPYVHFRSGPRDTADANRLRLDPPNNPCPRPRQPKVRRFLNPPVPSQSAAPSHTTPHRDPRPRRIRAV